MNFTKTEAKVNIYGAECTVRVMEALEQKDYNKKISESEGDDDKIFDAMFEALEKCGVKKEIASEMEIGHLTELVSFITSGKKK